jgi:hypothetical protein
VGQAAGDKSNVARNHDCKEAKTSNLLSSQELWSLFQATKAEAKGFPTGGSALMPKMQEEEWSLPPWSARDRHHEPIGRIEKRHHESKE